MSETGLNWFKGATLILDKDKESAKVVCRDGRSFHLHISLDRGRWSCEAWVCFTLRGKDFDLNIWKDEENGGKFFTACVYPVFYGETKTDKYEFLDVEEEK